MTLANLATLILLIAAFLVGLWLMIPYLYGLPWVPTRYQRIRKALDMAKLRPGEVLFDLGAGDGRVLIIAAREYQAQAVGIEISGGLCLLAWLRARFNHLSGQVTIKQANFYKTDLQNADVVFAYMTSGQAPRLRPHLESQLKAGARVVTISFDMEGWQPDAIDDKNLVFLYNMPATKGDVSSYMLQKLIREQGITQAERNQ
ncbi:MAG TPA: class I SAM-dependent methyltransferase [Anaerolineaceae bacterium]|nr:class I SAM-dependent methyltransferase [Anaerolineaceae bacterium]